ncbi:YfcL family protein [Pseudaeromonas sharmana]|uniref:YfcL family protein n=1 Tax=Pseudaeromonas sharmana TaxID=328412 RepID=A0ABV8CQ53_9GAMM
MNIHEFEQLLLAQIDAMVAHGSDDELFASGYLRGHISLAVANCEIHGKTLVRDVEMNVLRSLQQACLNGELNDQDQRLVDEMWQRLLRQVRQQTA